MTEGSPTGTRARRDFDERRKTRLVSNVASDELRIRSLSRTFDDVRRLLVAGCGLVFGIVLCDGLVYRGTLTFPPDLLSDRLSLGLTGIPILDADGGFAGGFDGARYLYLGLLVAGIVDQYVGGRVSSRLRVEKTLAGTFS